MQSKQNWNIFIVSLLIITAFILGTHVNVPKSSKVWSKVFNVKAAESADGVRPPNSFKGIQLYYDAYTNLLQRYVNPIKNTEELTFSAIRGLLLPLNDPYTRFMDPQEFKSFNEDTEGRFAGIGATLKTEISPAVQEAQGKHLSCPICGTDVSDLSYYKIMVVSTIPGSPAEKGGVLVGDHITKIDDKTTAGMTTTDAATNIRGPIGTKVTLTIIREGVKDPVVITLTRANIEIESVEHRIMPENIGYLKVSSFNEKTADGVRKAITEFNEKNVKGMLLDLRSNPGGRVDACIEMAGMFMPNNKTTVVFLRDRSGKMVPYDRDRGSKQLFSKPFVILVNGGSASASEIFTGMCMDYKLAKVVGEQTFGKALVQTVLPLDNGRCAIVITTAHYFTPSHFDLNKKGLEPNVIVELEKGTQMLDENDNQARRALEVLKEEIK